MKNENFDIQDLISFGYYVRKNPNKVMRETFLDWKKQYKRLTFKKKICVCGKELSKTDLEFGKKTKPYLCVACYTSNA